MAEQPKQILTADEVRRAIDQDSNFPLCQLNELAEEATSFINRRVGIDCREHEELKVTAKHCAKMYVRQSYYGQDGYNKDFDYSFGIASDIEDLKDIVRVKGLKSNA